MNTEDPSTLIGNPANPSDFTRQVTGVGPYSQAQTQGAINHLNGALGGPVIPPGSGNNFNNGVQIGTQINQVGSNIGVQVADSSFNNSFTSTIPERQFQGEEQSLDALFAEAETPETKSTTGTS